MKPVLFVLLLVSVVACNNAADTADDVVADTAVNKPQTDPSSKFIHTFSDTALENKIKTALLKLPFVIKSNNYIDSFSDHKHGIAFMLDNPGANETDLTPLVEADVEAGVRRCIRV